MVLGIEKTKYLLMIEYTKLKTQEREIMKKYQQFATFNEMVSNKKANYVELS